MNFKTKTIFRALCVIVVCVFVTLALWHTSSRERSRGVGGARRGGARAKSKGDAGRRRTSWASSRPGSRVPVTRGRTGGGGGARRRWQWAAKPCSFEATRPRDERRYRRVRGRDVNDTKVITFIKSPQ